VGSGSVRILMDTVDTYIKEPERKKDVPFLMAIEGIFMAIGRGTVLTGKMETGILKIGDSLEIIGPRDSISTICLGLETFRKSLEIAEVGDNVGILVKAVKKDEVKKGFVLAAVNTIKAYDSFKAKIYALTKKEGGRHKPFVSNYTPQFFFRTANVTGSIILPDEISVVMPGDSLVVIIKLVNKIPLNLGLRFIMREGNITIGAGIILEFI
jgi:elongation factor Tu